MDPNSEDDAAMTSNVREHLDEVAPVLTGELTSFCTVWYDDVTLHRLCGAGRYGACVLTAGFE